MQFSPKKAQIYTAFLRNHIQKSILKNDITEKILNRLKNIEIFEALYCDNTAVCTDAYLYLSILVYCMKAELLSKGYEVEVSVCGDGMFYIYRKPISQIICKCAVLARDGGEIKINIENSGVHIYYNGNPPDKILRALTKRMHSPIFSEYATDGYNIFIPLEKTDKKSEKIIGAVSLLTDRLSVIKQFTAAL